MTPKFEQSKKTFRLLDFSPEEVTNMMDRIDEFLDKEEVKRVIPMADDIYGIPNKTFAFNLPDMKIK